MNTPAAATRPPALRAAQIGLFASFILLALAYNLVIPVGEGVDELPHFEYVRFVGDNWTIPIQPWQDNGQPLRVWMAHHPPLYYFLMAGVSTWAQTADIHSVMQPNPHFIWTETDPSNGWNVTLHSPAEQFPYQGSILTIHYLRLWSLLMGLVTIVAIIKTGTLLLPSHPWIVLTAAALTAFHPAFLFMSSTLHHDPLMAMIFALSLWWMVRAIYQQPSKLALLAAGLLLGAGLITKLAGLSLVPLFGLTLLLIGWRDKAWLSFITRSFAVFGIALFIAGWWYARNQILYGDLLAWDMFLTIFAHMERQTPYSWDIFRHEFLGQLSRTFWGAFGYMHIILPAAIRRFFWWGSAFVLLGTLWAVWRRGSRLPREAKLAWGVLATAVLLVFLSFFRLSLNMLGAGQGRYLMTIILPLSLLLAIGVHQWLGYRWPRLTLLAVGLAFFTFSTWVLFAFVRPLYPLPTIAAAEQVTAAQQANVQFGDALALIGYQVDTAGIAPGRKRRNYSLLAAAWKLPA
jgi:4-amino-4-deoxy-L-arabinose transferase-like glycosyltransferase